MFGMPKWRILAVHSHVILTLRVWRTHWILALFPCWLHERHVTTKIFKLLLKKRRGENLHLSKCRSHCPTKNKDTFSEGQTVFLQWARASHTLLKWFFLSSLTILRTCEAVRKIHARAKFGHRHRRFRSSLVIVRGFKDDRALAAKALTNSATHTGSTSFVGFLHSFLSSGACHRGSFSNFSCHNPREVCNFAEMDSKTNT